MKCLPSCSSSVSRPWYFLDVRFLRAAVIVSLVLTTMVSATPASANVGKKCTKVGVVNKKYSTVCTRIGKKLKWVKRTSGSGNTSAGNSPGGSGSSGGSSSCASPVKFTKNFINPDHVQAVTPIGGQTAFGGSIAVRSYVMPPSSVYGQRLAVYAPGDMTLFQASYYLPPGAPVGYQPEYALYFDAGCGVQVQFFHIKGVVGAIGGAVPSSPSSSSAGQNVASTRVSAGDQIGWFQGEAGKSVAFDFRVEDELNKNSFLNQARFETSPNGSGELRAKCPYEYYVEPLRTQWMAKLGSAGGVVVPGTPCGKPSQGVSGTASGFWFLPNAKVNDLTFEGASFSDSAVGPAGEYMSQIALTTDADGMVRIGGLNIAAPLNQMMVGSNQATWKKPEDIKVGDTHCWTDSRQSVKVQVISTTSLVAVVGSGSCGSLSLSSGKTYER